MIVVDASALLEVLLNTPAAPEVGSHLFAESETIHAPYLIDVEILQALRRYAGSNEMGLTRAMQALQDYAYIPLNRHPHEAFLRRIWELKHNFTAYDAAYIALAEALEAPLVTCDRAFASARHRARIILIQPVPH